MRLKQLVKPQVKLAQPQAMPPPLRSPQALPLLRMRVKPLLMLPMRQAMHSRTPRIALRLQPKRSVMPRKMPSKPQTRPSTARRASKPLPWFTFQPTFVFIRVLRIAKQ